MKTWFAALPALHAFRWMKKMFPFWLVLEERILKIVSSMDNLYIRKIV